MTPMLIFHRRYSIEDVNKHCLTEFRKHWTCLDNNNQQLWQCRPHEWSLNKCVFENLVSLPSTRNARNKEQELLLIPWHVQKLEKVIPDTPKNETPVHLRKHQIYSHHGP